MTRRNRVAANSKPSGERTLWAYGYEIIPPHPEDRMVEVRRLIEQQNAGAVSAGRTWTARLVSRRVVHVMVVSSDPDPDARANRQLEAELMRVGVRCLMTVPMLVSDDPATP